MQKNPATAERRNVVQVGHMTSCTFPCLTRVRLDSIGVGHTQFAYNSVLVKEGVTRRGGGRRIRLQF